MRKPAYTARQRALVVNAILNGMTTREAAALVPGLSHTAAADWARQERQKRAAKQQRVEANETLREIVKRLDALIAYNEAHEGIVDRVVGPSERAVIKSLWSQSMELTRATRSLVEAALLQNGADGELEKR